MDDANKRPDETDGDDKPDFDKRKLYELWASSDQEGRELLRWLFHVVGLPVPYTLPEPPEEMSEALAIPALKILIRQSQALARENMRVSLGVTKLSVDLGNRMISDAVLAQIQFQEVIKGIIAELEKKSGL
jgi:hypothetical protein